MAILLNVVSETSRRERLVSEKKSFEFELNESKSRFEWMRFELSTSTNSKEPKYVSQSVAEIPSRHDLVNCLAHTFDRNEIR